MQDSTHMDGKYETKPTDGGQSCTASNNKVAGVVKAALSNLPLPQTLPSLPRCHFRIPQRNTTHNMNQSMSLPISDSMNQSRSQSSEQSNNQ